MKKVIFSFIGIAAVAVALISWLPRSTAKLPPPGAIHISVTNSSEGDGCSVLDGLGGEAFLSGKGVITPSDNWMFKCQGKVIPPPKGSGAVHYDTDNHPDWSSDYCGFWLDGVNYQTTDWKQVVSASGQTTLMCHFHP